MRRLLIAMLAPLLVLAACATAPKPRKEAYLVDTQGTVTAGTRSALDGTPAPGRQELIALYIPPMPGLPGAPDFRAGVTVDPSVLQFPIIIGPTAPATQAAPLPYAAAPACSTTTQTVMVQETYVENETIMVPQTRAVQKVRTVPRQVVVPTTSVPLPQAAPAGCGPQGPPPPTPAVSALDAPQPDPDDCRDGHCAPPMLASAKR